MASRARAVAMRCEGVARCTGSYIMLLRKRASLESRLLIWRNISCRQTARNRLVHHGVSAPIFISRRGRWTDVPLYHEVRRRSTIYLDICNNHTFSHLTHVTSLSMKKKHVCEAQTDRFFLVSCYNGTNTNNNISAWRLFNRKVL